MSESPIPDTATAPADDPDACPVAFAPVPMTRMRHDGWTPMRQRAFILRLASLGLVSPAARAVGMSPKSAYALRRRAGAESFAAAWDEALALGRRQALCHAIDRALTGVATPVFYRGRQVGERVRYNDRLTIAAITGRAPTRPAPVSPSGFAALPGTARGPELP